MRRVLWVFLLGILYTTNPNWVSRGNGIRLLFCCVGGRHLVLLGGTPYICALVVALLRAHCRSRPRRLRRSGRPSLGLRSYAPPELSEVVVCHPPRARRNRKSIVLTVLCSCCLRSSSAGVFHCISDSERVEQGHHVKHVSLTASLRIARQFLSCPLHTGRL